jgi:beta-glucosidase
LVDLHTRYPLPPIYITENGAAMADEVSLDASGQPQVVDTGRVAYYQAHLEALQAAMAQGVVVHGYFAWSLMDNFEWAEGYLKRFGIVYVDYQTQQRIKKYSALAFQALQQLRRG